MNIVFFIECFSIHSSLANIISKSFAYRNVYLHVICWWFTCLRVFSQLLTPTIFVTKYKYYRNIIKNFIIIRNWYYVVKFCKSFITVAFYKVTFCFKYGLPLTNEAANTEETAETELLKLIENSGLMAELIKKLQSQLFTDI